jgi:hypothetical protein
MNPHNAVSAGLVGAALGWVYRFVMVAFLVAALYVLSYGPMERLTCTVALSGHSAPGGKVIREPLLASWGGWTAAIYSPLLAVECGKAGPWAKRLLCWYVDLWLYGHPMKLSANERSGVDAGRAFLFASWRVWPCATHRER